MEIQEYERNIQEIWALFRETRESISAISRETRENSRETRERAREIDERFKEVSR